MPRQIITYTAQEVAEVLKQHLQAQGKHVVGDVTFSVTVAQSDGPYYSAATATFSAQYEDEPKKSERHYSKPVCNRCGHRGTAACPSCGYPGDPNDR